jgi:hypothetical protein
MRTFVGVLALVVLAIAAIPAGADWEYSDGWKMHYPQLPDSNGLDVVFEAPKILADDWKCNNTGPIDDIHFWFSAKGDSDVAINSISVRILRDIPANPPETLFSKPGLLLWQRDFNFGEFHVREYAQGEQGWYNPYNGYYAPNDHQKVYQCNIESIPEPFLQIEGSIYWLAISVDSEHPLGWKTTLDGFNDDAVRGNMPSPNWLDIIYPTGHPLEGKSLDLAFVVNGDSLYESTPEPEITFETPGDILPGATLEFSAQVPASMVLKKKATKQVVDLLSANVNVSIGSQIDQGGYSQVTVLGGSGQFDAYDWGSPMTRGVMALAGMPVGVSDFTITGGKGRIHWASGMANAQMEITVSAAGFHDIHAKAVGNGMVDFDDDTITIMERSHAWELETDEVPVSRMALLALTLILLVAGTIILSMRRSATARRR